MSYTQHVRNKKFKQISWNKVFSIIIIKSLAIVIGILLNYPIYGLIVSDILGVITEVILMNLQGNKLSFSKFSIHEKKQTILKFSRFLLFDLPANWINNFIMLVPTLYLLKFYSLEQVGFYGMAVSLMNMIVNSIGNSITPVYLNRIIDHKNSDNIKGIWFETQKQLMRVSIIALPGILMIYFLSELVIPVLLGDSWIETAKILKVISIQQFFYLLSFSMSPLFRAFRKEKSYFIINILCGVGLVLASIFMNNYTLSFYESITVFVIVYSVIYSIQTGFFLSILKRNNETTFD